MGAFQFVCGTRQIRNRLRRFSLAMRSHSRKSPAPTWPFGLLLLAWVCANCPPVASYAAIEWIGEGRSFSHQQRLTSEVARLLGTEVAEEVASSFSTTVPESPTALPKPTTPPDPTVKKIDLAVERSIHSLIPNVPVSLAWSVVRHAESALRAPPLLGPPRAVFVS
jgi:hypothetical protein